MKLKEFQARRAVFCHSILKNGIVMRLSDEASSFVLDREDSKATWDGSPPSSVSDNLHFAAKTWLRGSLPESPAAPTILKDLLFHMERIEDFAPAPSFKERASQLLKAADGCSLVMIGIEKRQNPDADEWRSLLNALRTICENVEQMDSRNSTFVDWMVSKLVMRPL